MFDKSAPIFMAVVQLSTDSLKGRQSAVQEGKLELLRTLATTLLDYPVRVSIPRLLICLDSTDWDIDCGT